MPVTRPRREEFASDIPFLPRSTTPTIPEYQPGRVRGTDENRSMSAVPEYIEAKPPATPDGIPAKSMTLAASRWT